MARRYCSVTKARPVDTGCASRPSGLSNRDGFGAREIKAADRTLTVTIFQIMEPQPTLPPVPHIDKTRLTAKLLSCLLLLFGKQTAKSALVVLWSIVGRTVYRACP